MKLPSELAKTASSIKPLEGSPTVPTKPSVPLSLTATAGDTFIQLQCSAPASINGSPIVRYEWTLTDPNSNVLRHNSHTPNTEFTGLATDTAFTATVAARNAKGLSTAATLSTGTSGASQAFDPRVYFAPLINGTGTPAGLGSQVDPATTTHYSAKGIMYVGTGATAVGNNFTNMTIDGDTGQVTKISSVGGSKGTWGTGNGSSVIATFTNCYINTNIDASNGAIQFTNCTISPTAASQFAFEQTNSGGVSVGSTRMDHCIVNGIIDASDPGGDCDFDTTAFLNVQPEPIFGKAWAGGLPGANNATVASFFTPEQCQAPTLQPFDPGETITQAMINAGPVLRWLFVKSYTDPKNNNTDVVGNRVFFQAIAPGLSDTQGASAPSSPIYAPHKAYFQLNTGDDSAPMTFTGGAASTDTHGTGGQAIPGTYAGPGAIWITQSGLSHADGLQWEAGGRCTVHRCYIADPSNSPAFMKCSGTNNPQPITGNTFTECLLNGGYNWWALLQHVNGPDDPNYASGKSGYPGGFYRNPANQSEWIPYTTKLGSIHPRIINFTGNWWGPKRDGVTYPSNPITDGSSLNGEHLNFVSTTDALTDAIVRQFSGYTFTTLQKTEIGSGIFDWAAWETANFTVVGGVTKCPALNQSLMNTRFALYTFPGMCDARTWVVSAGNVRADNGAGCNPSNYQDGK